MSKNERNKKKLKKKKHGARSVFVQISSTSLTLETPSMFAYFFFFEFFIISLWCAFLIAFDTSADWEPKELKMKPQILLFSVSILYELIMMFTPCRSLLLAFCG